MKLLKILAIVLLTIVAFKAALIVLGLASALLFTLFWVAVLYVVGMFIWKLMSGSKEQKSLTSPNYLNSMQDTANDLKNQMKEFKRQVLAKR